MQTWTPATRHVLWRNSALENVQKKKIFVTKTFHFNLGSFLNESHEKSVLVNNIIYIVNTVF